MPKTQQILFVSNTYIDKLEKGAKLLIEYPLNLIYITTTMIKKRRPIGKPRLKSRPQKIQIIKHPLVTQIEDVTVKSKAEAKYLHNDNNKITSK